MPRNYVKIDEHGKEILELKRAGKTNREIAPMLDVDKECIRNWMFRFNRQQRKLAAGIKLRPKGRPRKDAQPRDIVTEQAYKINRLKMENGLEAELDEDPGCRKYDYKNKATDNSRNGHSSKNLRTSFGELEPHPCAAVHLFR